MTTSAKEIELLNKCLKGDTKAFGVLVADYQELICAITYSGISNIHVSEELAHQAFINAWNKLPQLKDLSRFRPWLCSIARNLVKSFVRTNKRDIIAKAKPMENINDAAAGLCGPLQSAINKEHEELVSNALQSIAEKYREPLVLYYRQHQSVKQIARSLELSEEVAKKRLQRGRNMIKEQLNSIFEETLSSNGPKKAFTAAVSASVAGLALKGTSTAAAATVTATGVSGAGSAATAVTSIMSTVTAKIAAAAAVVVIGVGAAVAYKQITNPAPNEKLSPTAMLNNKETGEPKNKNQTANLIANKQTKPRPASKDSNKGPIGALPSKDGAKPLGKITEKTKDPGKTKAKAEGVKYTLRSVKKVFRADEYPAFILDVENNTKSPVTIGQVGQWNNYWPKNRSFGNLRLLFAENDKKTFNQNISQCPVITDPYEEPTIVAPGKKVSLGFEMIKMADRGSPKIQASLPPGRYVVGMGALNNLLKPDFKTNLVEVEILPVGVTDIDYLAKYLKPYKSDTMKIKAGFVPYKTEVVLGEPLLTTFTVKNLTDKPITFGFGGDYRGTGRHDRFKIDAVDSEGNPAADPKAGPDGLVMRMGGIMMFRTAHPNNLWTEIVNILDFRKIESPGVYTVNCSFTLTTDALGSGKNNSDIPVETSYELTVLPRTDRNVQRVLGELRQKAEISSHEILTHVINGICSFGGEDAVPVLAEMAGSDRLELCVAAIKGLAQVPNGESLAALIAAEADTEKTTRLAALEAMSAFTSDENKKTVIDVVAPALADANEDIRSTAAKTLGSMKGETVIDALIENLPKSEPKVASAILRAMGRTRSPRVFEYLVESLDNENSDRRYAAVDGLVSFGGDDVVKVLKTCVQDDQLGAMDDMNLREYIITKLVESMKQPIDARWFVPIIKSRKNSNSLGHPPRLMRLYTGHRAVPALLSCLDFENPSTRSYYQHSIIYSQGYCAGGLITPWVCDLNRDGTAEEIETNRRTLKKLKKWVEHYYENRMDEKPIVKYPESWGNVVDNMSIRIRVNQRVWPEGMPQLIMFDARNHPGEGSMNISKLPLALEVEINGERYVRQPALKEGTPGIEGMGKSVTNIVLDEKWVRVSDGKQLELKPGKHTLRVGLSIKPEDQRTGMVESKPIEIEVISTD